MLHHRLASRPWRPMALWFTYTAIVILFPLPLIIFLFAGMLDGIEARVPAEDSPAS